MTDLEHIKHIVGMTTIFLFLFNIISIMFMGCFFVVFRQMLEKYDVVLKDSTKSSVEDIKAIKADIQEEIKSRPQAGNIGKIRCVKRLDEWLEKYNV